MITLPTQVLKESKFRETGCITPGASAVPLPTRQWLTQSCRGVCGSGGLPGLQVWHMDVVRSLYMASITCPAPDGPLAGRRAMPPRPETISPPINSTWSPAGYPASAAPLHSRTQTQTKTPSGCSTLATPPSQAARSTNGSRPTPAANPISTPRRTSARSTISRIWMARRVSWMSRRAWRRCRWEVGGLSGRFRTWMIFLIWRRRIWRKGTRRRLHPQTVVRLMSLTQGQCACNAILDLSRDF